MTLVLFAIRRFVSAVVVLFAVSVLTFLIFFTIPNGDPALRIAGRTATPETIAAVRDQFGLDKPIYVQYYRMMSQIVDGSIESYSQHVGVFSQIERGLPVTISLAVGAALIWMIVGVVFGVAGAVRAGKASDVGLTVLNFFGISAPSFVVGSVMLYVFAFKLPLFPAGNYSPITEGVGQWLMHMILPWLTLAVLYIGIYAQVLRTSILETMSSDAIRTAHAKGLSPRRVLIRHVLRVSLIPIVSLWGLDFAAVLGGSTLVVELVFNLNGVGQYVAQSVRTLDVPPVLVVTMLAASFVVVMNAVVDILYAVLDPRIREESR